MVDVHAVMSVVARVLFTLPGLEGSVDEQAEAVAGESAPHRHLQALQWYFIGPATCIMLIVIVGVVVCVFKIRERCLTTPDVQEVNFDAGPTLRDL